MLDELYALVAFALLTQFVLFIRRAYRQSIDDRIQRQFVHDMATNHLPHIYSALRSIGTEMGIEIEEPPQIQFIELNGRTKSRD